MKNNHIVRTRRKEARKENWKRRIQGEVKSGRASKKNVTQYVNDKKAWRVKGKSCEGGMKTGTKRG